MANDMNQCNFTGRLGAQPELKYTPSGDAVCNFRMAVGEQWKNKSGEKQERTAWISVVLWRGLAEIAAKYLDKGSFVRISGKYQTREWNDKEGNKREAVEIVADQMQMLGSRGEGGQRSESRSQANSRSETGGGGYEPPFNPDEDVPFFSPYAFMEKSL